MIPVALAVICIGWTEAPMRGLLAVAAGTLAVTTHPALLPIGLCAVALRKAYEKLAARSKETHRQRLETAELADLIALGLTAGLGMTAAIATAVESLDGPVADEAGVLLRRMSIDGLAAAASAKGVAAGLFRAIARSASTGAPLLEPVTRIADELHAEVAADRLRAVRRLPVALLFPLTLLILPGFLLLTVAPAVLDAFSLLEP